MVMYGGFDLGFI